MRHIPWLLASATLLSGCAVMQSIGEFLGMAGSAATSAGNAPGVPAEVGMVGAALVALGTGIQLLCSIFSKGAKT
jgi:hypothetical protein